MVQLEQFCFASYCVDFLMDPQVLGLVSHPENWSVEQNGLRRKKMILPLAAGGSLQFQFSMIANEEDFAKQFRNRDLAHLAGGFSSQSALSLETVSQESKAQRVLGFLLDTDLTPSEMQLLEASGCEMYFANDEKNQLADHKHFATRICLELKLRKDFSLLAAVVELPSTQFNELLVQVEGGHYAKMLTSVQFLRQPALWLKLESTCADFIFVEERGS